MAAIINNSGTSLEELKARVAELQRELNSERSRKHSPAELTKEDLKPLMERYAFFTSQYPGSNYTCSDAQRTNITFVARTETTTNPKTGQVTPTNTVGEFWTDVPELADELDKVSFGIRRMTPEEVLACVKAQSHG